jgi:hypothetical protein
MPATRSRLMASTAKTAATRMTLWTLRLALATRKVSAR